jgi:hypothetical protein
MLLFAAISCRHVQSHMQTLKEPKIFLFYTTNTFAGLKTTSDNPYWSPHKGTNPFQECFNDLGCLYVKLACQVERSI